MSYLSAPDEALWLEAAERGADWWIAHVPEDRVAFWDFDDPAIPNTERDTAATAVASSGLLKLAKAAKDKAARAKYRAAAEATITALVTHYLTPTSPADKRAPGILTESCFNKRPDARPHDAANRWNSSSPTTICSNACWCWRKRLAESLSQLSHNTTALRIWRVLDYRNRRDRQRDTGLAPTANLAWPIHGRHAAGASRQPLHHRHARSPSRIFQG